MTHPLVSVIIPAFNGDRFIADAIDSVLGQTYPHVELIVVDDGSSDRSSQVVQSYGDRLRYLWQLNQGVAAARNQGLQGAQGDLIAFLDQDDCYHPQKLEGQVSCLKTQPQLGWVNSGWQIADEHGQVLSAVQPWLGIPTLDQAAWIVWKPVFLGAMLFRREWLDRVDGFREQFHYVSDVDLALRLAIAGCQADWVQQSTVIYRQHERNASRNVGQQVDELNIVLSDFFSRPDLPSHVQALEHQSRYQSLVWSAWRLYDSDNLTATANALKQSLTYANGASTAIIHDWVQQFKRYCAEYGSTFDSYQLTQSDPWQQLVHGIIAGTIND
ncbi:MAG TPA: glycosyltransferase family 2 protein [Elainellaceae cyanobacterium]|jgi:glycosyltransferase involved in cell wall biosynthesis